ncbi:inovirus Gp2 family protein, partial [Escherichia coli]|nr:inovirus Gp2 family protein [Escherichia coli]
MAIPYGPYGDLTMTYKYNPVCQQGIRETVRHALNVHPRLTAMRGDL